MTSEFSDNAMKSNIPTPTFTKDIINATINLILTLFVWYIFIFYLYPLVSALLGLIGFILGLIGTWVLLTYTFLVISRLFAALAYQKASMDTGVEYMNYPMKCPFLQRKRLTFICQAEQIAPFEVEAFEKCHKEEMWKFCWPERIPSILRVIDDLPVKEKNMLITRVLARMKEQAKPAASKMFEILTHDVEDLETRISAGFALSEMKEEIGIEPLVSMVGENEGRAEETVRAVIARYEELAVPYLIRAVQECETDIRCSGLVEIMGKIGHENTIPTLESILMDKESGELTKFQAIYALQTIESEKSYQILIKYLETASEEDKEAIKHACLSRKLISFPILIEKLTDPEIPEEYYAYIGDILAGVDAKTYDRFFTKLSETKDSETVQRLARILKDNTPDEEEFLQMNQVLEKHSQPQILEF